MPTLAAARPRTAGSTGRPAGGSSSAGAGSATSRTKASKPAGVVITSQRASLGLDAVGVRHVARGERRLAGAEDDLLARDEQRELALEHVEGLVVATVDVQRRHVAAPPALVEERERPAAGVPVDEDVDEVVDEPERLRPPGRWGFMRAPFYETSSWSHLTSKMELCQAPGD